MVMLLVMAKGISAHYLVKRILYKRDGKGLALAYCKQEDFPGFPNQDSVMVYKKMIINNTSGDKP